MSPDRRIVLLVAAALFLASAACSLAQGAVEPVKRIGIYVQPYYQSAEEPEGRPQVAVGKSFDALLSSNRAEDVLAARDAIRAEPGLVTPMTMMVLAIRLYDVGEREESVFWFYAAKDRYVTVAEVLDVGSPQLAQVEQAVRDFATLAGPTINGYAFCDPESQRELARTALEWVEKNPYRALFLPQIPARRGDREANLATALEHLRENNRKEAEYLANPDNLSQYRALRAQNHADEMYCWKE